MNKEKLANNLARRITGKLLNEDWNVNAEHALYHKDSRWYHVLERFPAAFFDPNGYILFDTEREYRNCQHLKIGKHVSVPNGIYSIPGYVLKNKETELVSVLSVNEPRPTYRVSETDSDDTFVSAQNTKENRAAKDLGNPDPKRVESVVCRVIRDTRLALWVKELHGYQCQICGVAIGLQGDRLYAEAHHIRPLGNPHNGPDSADNLICVCPNHHSQLDFGAIELFVKDLRQHSLHVLSEEQIAYHNREIYSSA